MKKKKGYSLFGTNKRKLQRNVDKYIEEYYEEYEEEYENEEYDNEEYDNEYTQEEDGAYYEDGTYYEDEYDYEDEAYEDETVEYYEDEAYEEEYAEYYEDEAYEEEYAEYYEDEIYEEEPVEYYEDEAYEEEYLYAEYDNEESFDIGYSESLDTKHRDVKQVEKLGLESILERIKHFIKHMTAFDAIVASTGVVLLVTAVIVFSVAHTSKEVEEQIQAIVPVGTELSSVGVVGESGLLAMTEAKIQGDTEIEVEEVVTSEAQEESVKVNVSFTSIERDLKIRFTDATTGELITGTAFEVVLTNSKGKKLILTDDDMDGIIYATSVNAGKFDAIVTSTDKYKFPTTPHQVTVKDKVEYVVLNVQDEVKSEAQVNVAVEDTEVKVQEEVKLTDTVEWVESSKTVVSGTEGYTKVDKSTIPDPAQLSMNARRMLFDELKVELDKTSVKLYAGNTETLTGTTYNDYEETLENGDRKEYRFSTEWKSSNDSVASVSDGTVTAKEAGSATITYHVTRKTITTKTVENNTESADGEQQAPTTETQEETESYSASCEVTVEKIQITSGNLKLTKTSDACNVGATLTVKPSEYSYTTNDGKTETKTQDFPTISWTSSDTNIAKVDGNGVVTGVKQGTATITGTIQADEVTITGTTNVTVNAVAALGIKLDRDQVSIATKAQITLVPSVSNYVSDGGVTWSSADSKIATVNEKGVVTGVTVGTVKITATTKEKDSSGNHVSASCVVTVTSSASSNTTTRLKDKDGRQIYVKNSEGKYVEAVYADYYTASEFFIVNSVQYLYKGWQTINGKTYFYDKNGNAVTGTQIIKGVTYNFGSDGAIQTTVNGSTFGIDVSKHNGNIDWNAVKSSGVDYVIIRCAYRGSSTGALITDPKFHANIKGATAAGLKVGIYVFSQAINEVEAVKEASLAVSLAQGYHLTYPIFIDTEASGGRADNIDKETRTAVVNAFCQTVQSAGYKAGIYASKTWYEKKLNMGPLNNYKIWLAQYAAAPTYGGRYDMWQYSSKGTISGINGKVDLNLSYLGY